MTKSNCHYSKLSSKTIKGFTLAEILIVLLIIGIVGSIVIPATINDTQNAELKTAWKKSYSDIDQATKRLVLDNGGDLKGLFVNTQDIRDKYSPYLDYLKKCDNGNTSGICWHADNTFKWLNGTPAIGGNGVGGILKNGSLIIFGLNSSDCSTEVGTPVVFTRCGTLNVDVNGFKGPNTIGKDIFRIHLLRNAIKPYGIQGDGYDNTCNPLNTGLGCSSMYLYQ